MQDINNEYIMNDISWAITYIVLLNIDISLNIPSMNTVDAFYLCRIICSNLFYADVNQICKIIYTGRNSRQSFVMSATITQKCQSKNLKRNTNFLEFEKVEMILGSIKVLWYFVRISDNDIEKKLRFYHHKNALSFPLT